MGSPVLQAPGFPRAFQAGSNGANAQVSPQPSPCPSWGCSDNRPQTERLQTTHIYFMALEATVCMGLTGLKSRCCQRSFLLEVPCFFQLLEGTCIPWLPPPPLPLPCKASISLTPLLPDAVMYLLFGPTLLPPCHRHPCDDSGPPTQCRVTSPPQGLPSNPTCKATFAT